MENQLMLPEPSVEALAEEMVRKQLKDYKVTMLAELIWLENEAKENLNDRLEYIKQKRGLILNLTNVPNYNNCVPSWYTPNYKY